jgi:hypothetical protein
MKLPSIQGIPLEYIKSILKIDLTSPSGLTWIKKFKTAGTLKAYKKNGVLTGKKYWVMKVPYNGKRHDMIVHRIILLLKEKELDPDKEVDHDDGNSLNNNPDNLRESTHSENMHNSKAPKNNTSGHKGVFWHKASGKWEVRIRLNGKLYNFGLYVNKEDAIKVAIESRNKLHGEFGRIK